MPSLKVVYFAIPGRAEPVRLALTLGGVPFEDEKIDGEAWGKLKAEVAPKQMPLLYVDGEAVGQSLAQLRYVAKLAKVDGEPLYPTDPREALRVDEFVDYVCEIFPPFAATFAMKDEDEKKAARAKLTAEGGDMHKWWKYVDGLLGASKSGFAVGDRLTVADLACFAFIQPIRSGMFDGVAPTCLEGLKNIEAHRAKIAAIPAVKARYASMAGPYTTLQA